MIYYVSNLPLVITSNDITQITLNKALEIMKDWRVIQYDCETSGLDPHLTKILTAQFGNKEGTIQIVVDCTTISIITFKDLLENRTLVGANLKFDIKFLFNYGIIPKDVWDVITIEQLRYLSVPKGVYPVNLAALSHRYLNIHMDKSVRNTIQKVGITESVIIYGATDVKYMCEILKKQWEVLKSRNLLKAAKIECDFVICCAYFEWCGVRLDVDKWQDIIWDNDEKLKQITAQLNKMVLDLNLDEFRTYRFPDLFNFEEPGWRCNINWKSPKQVIPLLKTLGFNTKVYDAKDKKYKETASAKTVSSQKDINPKFAELYQSYADLSKQLSTYGHTFINSINPKTDRIHTEYRALGTDTGRLASGNNGINEDLAKYKGLPTKRVKGLEDKVCTYPNMQNLPREDRFRECFIPKEGNVMISTDYSSQESRLLASLSGDEAMLDEYGPNGGEDMHSLVAKMVYPQLRNLTTAEIKKNHKDLRQKAKNPEWVCFDMLF